MAGKRRHTRFADFPAIVGAAGFLALTASRLSNGASGDPTLVGACVVLMLGAPFQRVVELFFGKYDTERRGRYDDDDEPEDDPPRPPSRRR